MNRFLEGNEEEIPLLSIDAKVEDEQRARVARVRQERDGEATRRALDRLEQGARGSDNLMPLLIDAARANATLGEMTGALKKVFGEYRETPFF